jgi:hypothetical protein
LYGFYCSHQSFGSVLPPVGLEKKVSETYSGVAHTLGLTFCGFVAFMQNIKPGYRNKYHSYAN